MADLICAGARVCTRFGSSALFLFSAVFFGFSLIWLSFNRPFQSIKMISSNSREKNAEHNTKWNKKKRRRNIGAQKTRAAKCRDECERDKITQMNSQTSAVIDLCWCSPRLSFHLISNIMCIIVLVSMIFARIRLACESRKTVRPNLSIDLFRHCFSRSLHFSVLWRRTRKRNRKCHTKDQKHERHSFHFCVSAVCALGLRSARSHDIQRLIDADRSIRGTAHSALAQSVRSIERHFCSRK